MAEGTSPQPTKSQLDARVGSFTTKNIATDSSDVTYTLTANANYPVFFIYGTNGGGIMQEISLMYSSVSTVYNGDTIAHNLNPAFVSQSSCTIAVKAYARLIVTCNTGFTIST